MFRVLFCYFLLVHILGDFYFQSDRLADKKKTSYRSVLLHGLIYWVVSFLCVLPFWSLPLLLSAGMLSCFHWLIDSIKYLYLKKGKREQNAAIYITDQLIHLGSMAVMSSLFIYMGFEFTTSAEVNEFTSAIQLNLFTVLRWTGLILMMVKPANITIKQLVNKYKPREDTLFNANKTGALIGALERMIMLLMLSVGQYAAIGLVLTAKSVARYNKIAEDKNFAEYYLLGTLLSVLFAISTYFLFS